MTAVMAEQARRERAVERAPADWVAQLASLGIGASRPPPGTSHGRWLITGWQRTQGISMWDGWHDILKLIGQLQTLHRLTPLGPLPSQWDQARLPRADPPARTGSRPGSMPITGGHDPRMLGKIRALLSKAEASTFTEEADAFTAKAQDLMTRYAIDEALLEDSAGHGDVLTRRIHIDNPYAQAKVQLLSTVGGINRVRVIWDDHHGMATAVGMAIDLELVEMLFTSLLVQATRALTEAGNSRTTEGYQSGRLNRAPSFRRAFLLAYANRIGERLEAAGAAASTRSDVEPRRRAGAGAGAARQGRRHDVRSAVPGDPADARETGRRPRLARRTGRGRPRRCSPVGRWKAPERRPTNRAALHSGRQFVPGHLRTAGDVELLRDPVQLGAGGPVGRCAGRFRRCR